MTEDNYLKQLNCLPGLHPGYIFLKINNPLKFATAAHFKLIVKFEMWKAEMRVLTGMDRWAQEHVQSRAVI